MGCAPGGRAIESLGKVLLGVLTCCLRRGRLKASHHLWAGRYPISAGMATCRQIGARAEGELVGVPVNELQARAGSSPVAPGNRPNNCR